MTLHQQGDCLAAIDCIERAIALEPQWPAFYHNLGNACWSVSQLTKAEGALLRALQMTPDSMNALATLGKVFYAQGRVSESMAAFDRVLALCPNPAGSRAAAYAELAMTDEAIAAYQRAAETTGDPAFRILAAIQMPPVYDSREHLLACRRRLETEIDSLLASRVVQDLDARPATPIFALPHQSFNDLAFSARSPSYFARRCACPHLIWAYRRAPLGPTPRRLHLQLLQPAHRRQAHRQSHRPPGPPRPARHRFFHWPGLRPRKPVRPRGHGPALRAASSRRGRCPPHDRGQSRRYPRFHRYRHGCGGSLAFSRGRPTKR